MRRKDREVSETAEILKIIDKCDVCRLGLAVENIPYVIPMNFGYEYADGQLVLYFHGAGAGKKIDLISVNSNACFEVDCSHRLITSDDSCKFSMEYESVIGTGKIVFCDDAAGKVKGMELIMKKYAPDKVFSFSEQQLAPVKIMKLTCSEFSGKRNIRK